MIPHHSFVPDKNACPDSLRESARLAPDFSLARTRVFQTEPLIHCITHPIVINDCANAVLALGARPIMAEHPREAARIAAMASALTVSLGNITDARAASMMLAGKERAAVLDLVGITCSPFRMELAKTFIRDCHPAIIKGNASEIRAIAGSRFHDSGIDVSAADAVTKDNPSAQCQMAEILLQCARQNHAVVLATGEVDMIADWENNEVYLVENGSPLMAKITGTGCMLTCIAGVYLAVSRPLIAALLAAVTMGIAGELAAVPANTEPSAASPERIGLGTYHIRLLDELSLLTDQILFDRMKIRRETFPQP